MSSPKMVIVDLDGTLLSDDRSVSAENRRALEAARACGVRVMAATGRSLGSVHAVLGPDAPIDAVAFSTGAGVIDWQTGDVLSLRRIERSQVRAVVDALLGRDIGFMLHAPEPTDSTFAARRSDSRAAADFDRRIDRYGSQVRAWNLDEPIRETIEVLLIEDADRVAVLDWARATFSDLSVIHATSPIDHQSLWIQLLAPGVCKAAACQGMAKRWNVTAQEIIGVGNDYNDIDFLDWVGHAYVVQNAPETLRARYSVVASNEKHGVAAALARHFAS